MQGTNLPGAGQPLDPEQTLEPDTPWNWLVDKALQERRARESGTAAPQQSPAESALDQSAESTLVGNRPLPSGTVRPHVPSSDSAPSGARASEASAGAKPETARYEIHEELARGGVGRICRALDPRLLRDVAFKELQARSLEHEGGLDRFIREAQVTGQLEHPGIVPVYDFGWQENGNPFYCMRLLKGRTLGREIELCLGLPWESAEQRLAFRKLLGRFIDVCQAVGYAHDRGVIHRDLKPANVMIGDFGETLVLDWGMAKVLGLVDAPGEPEGDLRGEPASLPAEDSGATLNAGVRLDSSVSRSTERIETRTPRTVRGSSLKIDSATSALETQAGAIVGTLAYMPPEQVLGHQHQIDARSDVYALGAILYEILTGQPPIASGSFRTRMMQIVEGNITSPRVINPTAPPALEAICLKALSRDKADRYATALLVAQDVEAYLADERVSAFPEPWHAPMRRFLRRNRTAVVGAASVALVLALAVGAVCYWDNQHVESVRKSAERHLESAARSIEEGEFGAARDALKEATGLLAAESKLRTSHTAVRIADLERLRHKGLAHTATAQAEEAEDAERAGDLTLAGRILSEAMLLVRTEHLPELKDTLTQQQQRVQALLAAREQASAEAARQEDFLNKVDQARFHCGLLRADRTDRELAEARRHALAALAVYDLAEQVPARPVGLSESAWNRTLDDALEMFLIVANSDLRMPHGDDPTAAADLGRRTLAWLDRGRKLGRKSRVLEIRAAECAALMGDRSAQTRFTTTAEALQPQSAFDFFLLADEARKQGEYEQAIPLYHQTLQRESGHFWAQQFLGVCQLHLQQPEAAVAHFTSCLAVRPDFAWTLAVRGIAYAELKDFSRALDDFEAAETLDPKLVAVPLNRGAVYFLRGDYDAAIANFDKAARMQPELADPLINLAEALRKQAQQSQQAGNKDAADEQVARALSRIERAIELAPENPAAFRLRGELLLVQDRFDGAIESLRRSMQHATTDLQRGGCEQLVAAAHERAGRFDDAVRSLREALKKMPFSAEAHWQLAQLLKRRGHAAEAVKEYGQALAQSGALDPLVIPQADAPVSVAEVYRARSLAAAWVGEYRQAMNDYTRALELDPAAPLLTRRGWAYLTQSQKLALADFEDALRLNPDDPDSYCGRGYARVLLGDTAAGLADAEEAVRRLEPKIATDGADTWGLLFNAATIYAQAATSAQGEDRDRHLRRSVEILTLSRTAAGEHLDIFHRSLDADPTFDPHRRHEGLQELIHRKPKAK